MGSLAIYFDENTLIQWNLFSKKTTIQKDTILVP